MALENNIPVPFIVSINQQLGKEDCYMQTQLRDNIQSNVVQLEVVKKSKQNPKLKTDGTEKQTPNNNSVDRWVHPIREKTDVKKCIDYLHEKALSATRLDTQRAAFRDWFLFVVGINVGLGRLTLITNI